MTKQIGIVLAVAIVFAFAANFLSPAGLSLTRDYFPTGLDSGKRDASETTSAPGGEEAAPTEAVAERLRANGLQPVFHGRVVQLHGSQRHQNGDVVFIDARGKSTYRQGHIPGAYPFSHYRIEDYLQTILPVCEIAEMIIVYCQGVDCQDSEMAAMGLRDLGVSPDKLYVYIGGMSEWRAADLPVATGKRDPGKGRSTSQGEGP